MEENNNFFLACHDALVYLAEPMHKKYCTTFAWGHPFSTYVSYDRSFNPLPQYVTVHILGNPPPFPKLCTYLMDGLFLDQKQEDVHLTLPPHIFPSK